MFHLHLYENVVLKLCTLLILTNRSRYKITFTNSPFTLEGTICYAQGRSMDGEKCKSGWAWRELSVPPGIQIRSSKP